MLKRLSARNIHFISLLVSLIILIPSLPGINSILSPFARILLIFSTCSGDNLYLSIVYTFQAYLSIYFDELSLTFQVFFYCFFVFGCVLRCGITEKVPRLHTLCLVWLSVFVNPHPRSLSAFVVIGIYARA